MLLSWLLMRELQVRVAHGALSVSFGPFRTSVPLERIESVRLVTSPTALTYANRQAWQSPGPEESSDPYAIASEIALKKGFGSSAQSRAQSACRHHALASV